MLIILPPENHFSFFPLAVQSAISHADSWTSLALGLLQARHEELMFLRDFILGLKSPACPKFPDEAIVLCPRSRHLARWGNYQFSSWTDDVAAAIHKADGADGLFGKLELGNFVKKGDYEFTPVYYLPMGEKEMLKRAEVVAKELLTWTD